MLKVTALEYRGEHRLFLTFSDGTSGMADLASSLDLPALQPLRTEALFAKAYLDLGTVCWPGELDLAVEHLYALAHGLPAPKTLEQARANEACTKR